MPMEPLMRDYLIAPSILAADFARLGQDVEAVLDAGADIVHFDVMDNHYVPNLTIGPMVCSALRDYGISVPIDVHLMVQPVDSLIRMFAEAGATYITFHPEASENVEKSLRLIRDLGCKNGLVLNPDTSITSIDSALEKIDMLVLMSVYPGFGGQSFIDSTYEKIKNVRAHIDSKNIDIRLEVDGGITELNVADVASSGADTFVAGSAIFSKADYKIIIDEFRKKLNNVSI